MKRKTKKELVSTRYFAEKRTPAMVDVVCTYSTRVVVKNAPSGKVYDFQPGQTQPVSIIDLNHLLSLQRTQGSGCCGGNSGPVKYFQEA